MPDPIQDLVLQAAISAGTDRAISGLAAAGKALLPRIWAHLSQKGRKEVETNLANFADRLATEVQNLVDSGQLSRSEISMLFDQPESVAFLVQAFTHAAEIANPERQVLLAKLVAERMHAKPETDLALASRMACDAIAQLTANQLKLLGLCYTLSSQKYDQNTSVGDTDQRLHEIEWLVVQFAPYRDLEAAARDVQHLEAAACVGGPKGWVVGDLPSALKRMTSPELDVDAFVTTKTGEQLNRVWRDSALFGLVPTSIGSLIGMYTADLLANRLTDLSRWAP